MRPFLVASPVTPTTALAPLFIIWFGSALLTFFPVLVNTVAGIMGADADRLALMRVCGVSRWQTLRFVKLPGAMPQIMSGIEVSSVMAVMGAVIGEFVGAKEGLGRLIVQAGEKLDLNLVFAAILVLIVMGAGLQGVITWLNRRLLFWVGR